MHRRGIGNDNFAVRSRIFFVAFAHTSFAFLGRFPAGRHQRTVDDRCGKRAYPNAGGGGALGERRMASRVEPDAYGDGSARGESRRTPEVF